MLVAIYYRLNIAFFIGKMVKKQIKTFFNKNV